jgi:hypothetical protein
MPELQVAAPEGAHFDYEEVKTAKGASSLGNVPILVWDRLDAARVSFQNIARRLKIAQKSDEDIATAMVNFRPGKRQVGASTPASRAARAAKAATEKVGGDAVEALLAKIASGELSAEDIEALAK